MASETRFNCVVAPSTLMGSTPWAPRIARYKRGLQSARFAAATGARTRVHEYTRPTNCLWGHSGWPQSSSFHFNSGSSFHFNSGSSFHFNSGSSFHYNSGSSFHFNSGSSFHLNSGSSFHLNSTVNFNSRIILKYFEKIWVVRTSEYIMSEYKRDKN